MSTDFSEQQLESRDGLIEDVCSFAQSMHRLLEEERNFERDEMGGRLESLSPSEAQAAGLSILHLKVSQKCSALFGRTKISVRKTDERD